MSVKELIIKARDLRKLDDDSLIKLVQRNDDKALDVLIKRYKNFVRAKAHTYFMIGADKEDIIQEGMIGLYKAIRDYEKGKVSSFKAFAELCIVRQIITAIKTATRQKHVPLNSYISLDRPMYDEESDRTLLDTIGGSSEIDPEEMLINQEKHLDFESRLFGELSGLEKEALRLYMDGMTYQEISRLLKRHVKSIDNALQRVKRKIEQLIDEQKIVL